MNAAISRGFPQALTRLPAYQRAALILQHPPVLSLPLALSLLVIHAFGLLVVAQLARAPLWLVGAVVGAFVVAQFIPRVRDILSPALLAPLWFVYLFVAVRFLWLRAGRGEIGGYFEYTLPDPRVLLRFEFFVAAAVCYSALIFAAFVLRSRGKSSAMLAVVATAAVLGWAVIEYFGHRTFGATGSDPFAYVQMGLDLVTRGTAAHHFALFPLVAADQISWFPVLHVGYHLPFNLQGDAITVWSLGGALAYCLAYRVAGEGGLYLVNPFFSLLGVLVSGLLAWELTRSETRVIRVVTACAVAILVATSNELVNWAGVTMVDTQALVFSALAMYCGLRVYRTGKWGWAIAAGLCWGFAYFVRHTQLVIFAGMAPLLLLGIGSGRTRLHNLVLVGAAAFLMALPDLWYHQTYLGNWLTPESKELALYSLGAIPTTLAAMGQSALIGAEFGWLACFILAGIFLYARRERVAALGLLLWLIATLAVHLPYVALRLRDLIPEFPILAFFAAYGMVAGIRGLLHSKRRWAGVAAAAVIFLALELGLVRVWNTLPRAIAEPSARFGAMTQAQRASFDTLAQLMPQNAIVGASLNSGAIELYAQRNAFRPADWCTGETCDGLSDFLTAAEKNEYEIYLLEDNASLEAVLTQLEKDYRAERVATLDVPLFGDKDIPEAGALWKMTR